MRFVRSCAGMTRIRFKESLSVPYALAPWRAVPNALTSLQKQIRWNTRRTRRRPKATGGTPLGTCKE